jgi:hypothetical protein
MPMRSSVSIAHALKGRNDEEFGMKLYRSLRRSLHGAAGLQARAGIRRLVSAGYGET